MNRFYDALAALAVILTPVAMMTAFGWSAYTAILAETGVPALAALSGIATAAAIEVIGIVAGETALWFHGRNDRRWMTAGAILALYVVFGLVILRGSALMLLPLMAGSVYALVGLRAQAARETAAENGHNTAAMEWEREQWRIRQADRTRVKLAEVATSASTEPAQSKTEPAPSGQVCEDCGKTFATVQALNAHRRFCAGIPALNGKVTQ